MSSNAISPVKEMPRFHPLSVVKRDYLRAGASVLVACRIIATCGRQLGPQVFTSPQESRLPKHSVTSEVEKAKQQEHLLM